MTVKELKEILNACNDDAIFTIIGWDTGRIEIQDKQIFANPNGTEVTIDVDGYYDNPFGPNHD